MSRVLVCRRSCSAHRLLPVLLSALLLLAACGRGVGVRGPAAEPMPQQHALIPLPASVALTPADSFAVTEETEIFVAPGDAEAVRIGRYLSMLLAPLPEMAPPLRPASGGSPPEAGIYLATDPARSGLGEEGYELTITPERVTVRAYRPAGLFYGVQTFRQLLPPAVEYGAARPRILKAPTGRIVDEPRFTWRGAMLDVARHFRDVEDVKRYLDLMALYKLNRLHLHLSDDQGWRIAIDAWPELTRRGGSTGVGGSPGGFYTKEDYAEIVRYAQDRFITIVPEIDMPGHTNAALASYPELNCDGVAPALFTGIEVGFSTLCVDKEVTYRFVDDVVREIAAMTPGPYFHLGGDEVEKLTDEEYRTFIERVQEIVRSYGKRAIGWGEIAPADLLPTTIVQYWRPNEEHVAEGGVDVILSPSTKIYLDMKYDPSTVLGLNWAGYNDVRDAYEWEPAAFIEGLAEEDLLGIEAPLWSETLATIHDVEYMAFPRLAGVAEIGWSPPAARSWDEYRIRLGAQAPRWNVLGLNYYRSPLVPWQRGR